MNTTSAPTASPHPSQVIMTFMLQMVCMTVLVFGIVGNGCVIIILGRMYADLKTYEVYMLSLAVSDFIGTLLFPSIQLHSIHGGDFIGIGDVGCKLIYFLLTCSITSSAMTLIVVSFDRFIIVKWPLRERLPPFTLGYTITLPWIFGICHGFIYLIDERMILEKDGNIYICRIQSSELGVQVFTVATLIIQNVLPVILMSVIYSCIVRILYKSEKTFNLSRRESDARHDRNQKAIKLLLTVISVFFVCTTPHNIFHLWYVYNFHFINLTSVYPVYMLVTMLYACNSCLNPLIYARLHDRFREDVLALICCRKKVRRRINMYLTIATSSNGWFSNKKELNGKEKAMKKKSMKNVKGQKTCPLWDSPDSVESIQLNDIYVFTEFDAAKETSL